VIGSRNIEAFRTEQERQARILAQAIQDTIERVGKTLGTVPMLNAVAGALITVEAAMLASCPTTHQRKALKKEMDAARPRALAMALKANPRKAQALDRQPDGFVGMSDAASVGPVNRSSEELAMRALIVPELRRRWPTGRVPSLGIDRDG